MYPLEFLSALELRLGLRVLRKQTCGQRVVRPEQDCRILRLGYGARLLSDAFAGAGRVTKRALHARVGIEDTLVRRGFGQAGVLRDSCARFRESSSGSRSARRRDRERVRRSPRRCETTCGCGCPCEPIWVTQPSCKSAMRPECVSTSQITARPSAAMVPRSPTLLLEPTVTYRRALSRLAGRFTSRFATHISLPICGARDWRASHERPTAPVSIFRRVHAPCHYR